MKTKEEKAAYAKAYYAANKEVIAAREKAYRAANKDKIAARMKVYQAANKNKISAYQAANKEKKAARMKVYRSDNKDKIVAYDKAYYQANKDKRVAYENAYHAAYPEIAKIKNHRRRARIRKVGGTLSKGLTEKLYKLQRGKCPCCRLPLGKDFHLDHILPLALGGSNTDDNIQLLRKTCNLQKNKQHPVDFMQSRGFLL